MQQKAPISTIGVIMKKLVLTWLFNLGFLRLFLNF